MSGQACPTSPILNRYQIDFNQWVHRLALKRPGASGDAAGRDAAGAQRGSATCSSSGSTTVASCHSTAQQHYLAHCLPPAWSSCSESWCAGAQCERRADGYWFSPASTAQGAQGRQRPIVVATPEKFWQWGAYQARQRLCHARAAIRRAQKSSRLQWRVFYECHHYRQERRSNPMPSIGCGGLRSSGLCRRGLNCLPNRTRGALCGGERLSWHHYSLPLPLLEGVRERARCPCELQIRLRQWEWCYIHWQVMMRSKLLLITTVQIDMQSHSAIILCRHHWLSRMLGCWSAAVDPGCFLYVDIPGRSTSGWGAPKPAERSFSQRWRCMADREHWWKAISSSKPRPAGGRYQQGRESWRCARTGWDGKRSSVRLRKGLSIVRRSCWTRHWWRMRELQGYRARRLSPGPWGEPQGWPRPSKGVSSSPSRRPLYVCPSHDPREQKLYADDAHPYLNRSMMDDWMGI